mmetsp:Transcript_43808/g.95437  ORF Transcript_43808/g.95437 Transcript_43808/m.95437 type:complete len:214 (+) Transcript_43808:182-823(+)
MEVLGEVQRGPPCFAHESHELLADGALVYLILQQPQQSELLVRLHTGPGSSGEGQQRPVRDGGPQGVPVSVPAGVSKPARGEARVWACGGGAIEQVGHEGSVPTIGVAHISEAHHLAAAGPGSLAQELAVVRPRRGALLTGLLLRGHREIVHHEHQVRGGVVGGGDATSMQLVFHCLGNWLTLVTRDQSSGIPGAPDHPRRHLPPLDGNRQPR